MTPADVMPIALTAIGGGGIGAGIRPLLDYWKAKRGQTDDVAMSLVEKLQGRIERLEEASASERLICDAKLELMRAELKNVGGSFDSLLLAIEIAPEKAAEVVAKIKARRSIDADQGERRQQAQKSLSEARVLRDEP